MSTILLEIMGSFSFATSIVFWFLVATKKIRVGE